MLKHIVHAFAIFLSIAFSGFCYAFGSINQDKIISRELFFNDPQYSNVQVSHDGKYLAYLAPSQGVLNVWVGKMGQRKSMHSITHKKSRGVSAFCWAYNNENILYIDDYKGNENWRLYQVDVKTGQHKSLFSSKKIQGRIIALSPEFPDEILIGLNRRRADLHDLYKLNIKTGKLTLLYENNEFSDFVCDKNLQPKIALTPTRDGGAVVYVLGKDFSKRQLFTVSQDDLLTSNLLTLNKNGDALFFLDSKDRDTAALFRIKLDSKEKQLIASEAKADIDEVLFHPTELIPLGYSVTYEQQKWFALDPSFQEDLDYLNSVSSGVISIVSGSLDNTKWIVVYNKDVGSPRYYFYDRLAKKAYFLFSSKPGLDKLPLIPMKTVIINSRDYLPLVSYLSLPKGINKYKGLKSKVPLVLLVHGGPNLRDCWGYNGIHQWLANRGYAVLSVNFRGSSGFGKKFINAGNGEWGAKMHEDLVDAVHWAIDKGITSPDQVAIMGGSYGGYATLIGLTKTPNLFACGIDIVGPSNLQTFMQTIPEYWKPFYASFKKKVGGDPDTKEGKVFLKERSPITYVDSIKKPLLIGHGAKDPRVKQSESEQIVRLMKSKKIPVIYLLYPDEGHGFRRPENRLSFFAIAEIFLAENLKGGRAESLKKKDFKNSSIQVKEGKEYIPINFDW